MSRLALFLFFIITNISAFSQKPVNLENVEIPGKIKDRTERVIVHEVDFTKWTVK